MGILLSHYRGQTWHGSFSKAGKNTLTVSNDSSWEDCGCTSDGSISRAAHWRYSHAMCVQVAGEPIRGHGAGLAGRREPPDVSAEDRTWVVWENSKCFLMSKILAKIWTENRETTTDSIQPCYYLTMDPVTKPNMVCNDGKPSLESIDWKE